MSAEEEIIKNSEEESSDATEPLSGKPFFHVVLHKSHIGTPYQLIVPSKIARELPSATVPVIITCGSRSWDMTYAGDRSHKRLDLQMWKQFVADNNLKVGDACVFELMENKSPIKFKVQILRGDFPSELKDMRVGTIHEPVVCD